MSSGVVAGIGAVRLDAPWLVWSTAVFAVGAAAGTVWRWGRQGRAGRTACVLVSACALVLAGALAVNRAGSFYPTLDALGSAAPQAPGVGDLAAAGSATAIAVGGAGTVRRVGRIGVYEPAGYESSSASLRYPVVEWVGPASRLDALAPRLDAAVAARRLPPVLVVAGNDPDALRRWATAHLRVRSDPGGWVRVGARHGHLPGDGGPGSDDATLAWLGTQLLDPVVEPGAAA